MTQEQNIKEEYEKYLSMWDDGQIAKEKLFEFILSLQRKQILEAVEKLRINIGDDKECLNCEKYLENCNCGAYNNAIDEVLTIIKNHEIQSS